MKMSARRRVLLISVCIFIVLCVWCWREALLVVGTGIESWTEDRSADCAVVLTGGPGRIREGFDLLDQGWVKKLVISGVHPDAKIKELFPLLALHAHVNTRDVILEKYSQTTFGNAQQTRPIVETLGCRDLMLVTSRIHMYRALRTFRKTLPASLNIHPRAVVAGEFRSDRMEVFFETLKSMFYSVWAY